MIDGIQFATRNFMRFKLAHIGAAAIIVALTVAVSLPTAAQSTRELANRIAQLEQDLQSLKGASSSESAEMTPEVAAGVQVRVLRLEQLLEQLTGQIEETRFRVGQMSTQLRQLSDDVNYRLAILEQAVGVGGAVAAAPTTTEQNAAQTQNQTQTAVRQVLSAQSGEALSQPVTPQPGRAQPQLSTSAQMAVGPPQNVTPNGQMVLRTDGQGQALPANPNDALAPVAAPDAPPAIAPAPLAAPNPSAVTANQLAALPPPNRVELPDGTPKEQYEYAFNFLTRNDFASAEVALREFLTRHPEDPLAGNAQYWLGETFYVRGDYKQAAVEFMAGYQNYPSSNKGPDNLLKLGMSMASLGQTQGACTALNRISKDYADAPDQIRRTAEAQQSELRCN